MKKGNDQNYQVIRPSSLVCQNEVTNLSAVVLFCYNETTFPSLAQRPGYLWHFSLFLKLNKIVYTQYRQQYISASRYFRWYVRTTVEPDMEYRGISDSQHYIIRRYTAMVSHRSIDSVSIPSTLPTRVSCIPVPSGSPRFAAQPVDGGRYSNIVLICSI